jgi:hypothetical protein
VLTTHFPEEIFGWMNGCGKIIRKTGDGKNRYEEKQMIGERKNEKFWNGNGKTKISGADRPGSGAAGVCSGGRR